MDDVKYKMNIFEILFSAILALAIVCFLVFCYDRFINFEKYHKEEEKEKIEKESLDISSVQVQLINPISGDFSNSGLLYLTKIKTMKRSDLTNEFVLKMALAKLSYQDLGIDLGMDYNTEGDSDVRFAFKADVLEKEIGNIFGSLNYYKNDFNTLDLYLMNSDKSLSDSFLYSVKYNKRKDEYSILFNNIAELIQIQKKEEINSNVIPVYQEATKYEDRIELDIYPIFIKKQGNLSDEDAAYICYKSYNWDDKKFVGKLTDTIYVKNEDELSLTEVINRKITDVVDASDNNSDGSGSKNELDEAIKKIDKSQLSDFKFIYTKTEDDVYVFDSFEIKDK